jgi:hypothetical protein
MKEQTDYHEIHVKMCAKDLVLILGMALEKRHFRSIYRKYASMERGFVSELSTQIIESRQAMSQSQSHS